MSTPVSNQPTLSPRNQPLPDFPDRPLDQWETFGQALMARVADATIASRIRQQALAYVLIMRRFRGAVLTGRRTEPFHAAWRRMQTIESLTDPVAVLADINRYIVGIEYYLDFDAREDLNLPPAQYPAALMS